MDEKWTRDTGLVAAIVCLIVGLFTDSRAFFVGALAFTALVLLAPSLLKPLAYFWKRVAELLGVVSSTILFGAVFFLIITPVGLVRRLLWGDKRDQNGAPELPTAFTLREQTVAAKDLAHPF